MILNGLYPLGMTFPDFTRHFVHFHLFLPQMDVK